MITFPEITTFSVGSGCSGTFGSVPGSYVGFAFELRLVFSSRLSSSNCFVVVVDEGVSVNFIQGTSSTPEALGAMLWSTTDAGMLIGNGRWSTLISSSIKRFVEPNYCGIATFF